MDDPAERARREPKNPIARLLFADALRGRDDDGALREYRAALALDPHLVLAHRGAAAILTARGEQDAADRHTRAAHKPIAFQTAAYTGSGTPVRVLQIGSAILGGHTNTDAVLHSDAFETTTLIVEFWDPARPLPEHDVVFNIIADPDICGPALDVAQWILESTRAPVINAPGAIRSTGRLHNAERLRGLSGVKAPLIALVDRAELARDGSAVQALGFSFPLLIRTPGFHMGKHFVMVESVDDVARAIAELPGESLYVIEYFDVRRPDGRVVKYRAMIVGSEVLPAHLALSPDWKVHYFSARMGDRERAEERQCLADMRGTLGPRIVGALEAVRDTLMLEYAGLDFGVTPDGDLAVFEANASMTLFVPEPGPRNEYRRAAVERINNALGDLVKRAATRR